MKVKDFLYFSYFGIRTVLFKKKDPILGTIILTDKCNLKCKHCAVNNITTKLYPYEEIKKEMKILYDMGIRILFFCGGETFLWQDNNKTLRDLVSEAKEMGFLIVNIVTNGTFPIDIPEADLILLSLDGDRQVHNFIRGETFDNIMENIENATSDNICFYMAINQINKTKIKTVCELAKSLKNVRAVSFNFHTPYTGTKALRLNKSDKLRIISELSSLMDDGYPIFNLKSTFPYIANNEFSTPCYQCVVIENGVLSACGRCINEEGLCDECGYFFVGEYTMIFSGKIRIIIDMLKTYLKFI